MNCEHERARLLSPDDPPPYTERPGGNEAFLVVCDHASVAIPRALGSLGLDSRALERHIASDIGARWVAQRVAGALGATAIFAGYSRLVIDCNRYPDDPAAMAARSDGVEVAGNHALGEDARRARIEEIFLPYHRAIGSWLAHRRAAGGRPVLLSIHSCTPVLAGVRRPWPIGLSYVPPGALALRVVEALRRAGIEAGDNQPYAMDTGVDFTSPEHALRRGLACLQVEFRQDLVATPAQAHAWADRFLDALAQVPDAQQFADPPWTPDFASPLESHGAQSP
jgi:predicted N-formylglutamate amidohydrolase